MKTNWNQTTLGEVLTFEYGRPLDDSLRRPTGQYPVYGASGQKSRADVFYVDRPSIIVGRKGSAGEVTLTESRFWPLDVTYFASFDEDKYDLKFLYYLLKSLDLPRLAKGVKPGINRGELYSQSVRVPQRQEQQRIARILDESLAAVSLVDANIEMSLRYVQTLVGAYLESVLTQAGEGWRRTTIGEQVTLQRGFDITKDQQNPGSVPVVSSGGIKSYHDTPMVESPGVVLGRKGTLGKVFYLDTPFWPHDTTLWIKEFNGNNARFVYYFFTMLDVSSLNSGTANPALNRNQVHPIEVNWPSVEIQERIVSSLDGIADGATNLESIYRCKAVALKALERSLFHHAFTGQL
jgi:type I restriction enzyme, S subunit